MENFAFIVAAIIFGFLFFGPHMKTEKKDDKKKDKGEDKKGGK